MKKPLFIFGSGQNSRVAHEYITEEVDTHEVKALVVDDIFYSAENKPRDGIEVISLSTLVNQYNTSDYEVIAPLYGAHMGRKRQDVYERLKNMGCNFYTFISKRAKLYNKTKIGENCLILDGNTIQPYVEIGNNVTLWSNNHIGHHSIIGDHCTITSQVTVSGNCKFGQNCFLGVSSATRDGCSLGEYSFIGMGAMIANNTEPYSVWTAIASEMRKAKSSKLRW